MFSINRKIICLFLMITPILVKSQKIIFIPNLGVSFINNRLIEKDKLIRASQLWGLPYIGTDFGLKKGRNTNIVGASISNAGLMAKYYFYSEKTHRYNIGGRDKIGVNLYNFSYKFERNIIQPKSRNIRYFCIHSILGGNFYYTQKNVNWNGGSIDFSIDTDSTGLVYKSSSNWDVGALQNKRFYGFSALLGIKFQRYFLEKQKYSISFIYSQGLFDLFSANFNLYEIREGKEKFTTKRYVTRGSYLALYLSYPITILNQKGERYRDRHPKE